MQKNVYIVNGARTPFGSFGGSLSDVNATQLGVAASVEAIGRSGITAEVVDNVVFGHVIQAHRGAQYLARHIALDAGVREEVPALTVNRLCGSGLQSVVSAAQEILLGDSQIALAGGAESMSQSPYVLRGARFGQRMGDQVAVDLLTEVLTDCRGNIPMGITAENLAGRYGISREEQDEFAVLSHHRAAAARTDGRLSEEITSVSIPSRKGDVVVSVDEHIRPDSNLAGLARLRPVFRADGTVTAGNASGINDGAAAVVVASEEAVVEHGLKPLCRIVSYATAGVDPAYMGIGPVPAIRMALQKASLTVDDVDLWEVNEAFAAQYLSVERELGLPRERTNVNGGAIALGHPVGASGARILLTLMYELKKRQLRYGVASLCIGGGQGIAMVVERVS